QHAAAEGDLVGAEIFARRPVVDGKYHPGAHIPAAAEAEARRNPSGGVIGLTGRIERSEQIGLEPRPEEAAGAIAERKVDAVLDAGLVEWRLDVVDVDSAEHFSRACGSRNEQGDRRRIYDCDQFHAASPSQRVGSRTQERSQMCLEKRRLS